MCRRRPPRAAGLRLVWVTGATVALALLALLGIPAAALEDAQDRITGSSTATAAPYDDETADGAQTDDGNGGQTAFAELHRVIVSTDGDAPDEGDRVLSAHGDTYLLAFETADEARDAIDRYEGRDGVNFAELDSLLTVAGDDASLHAPAADLGLIGDEPQEGGHDDAGGDRRLVALIDSGAPACAWLTSRSSVIGSDPDDGQGHGTRMVETMIAEDEGCRVMSIRALDDSGTGTIASVYAGIEQAVARGAQVINLSLCGRLSTGSKALGAAVSDALEAGCTVVAAAGNDGCDAALFVPASLNGVVTVGACGEDGTPSATSNHGACVDGYLRAGSTSVACARASAQLARDGFVTWEGAEPTDGEGVAASRDETSADDGESVEDVLLTMADYVWPQLQYRVFYKVNPSGSWAAESSWGWSEWATNNVDGGTTLPAGRTQANAGTGVGGGHATELDYANRIRSMQVRLVRGSESGGIEFQWHRQNEGDSAYYSDANESVYPATSNLRLEGMRVRLTGDIKNHFFVSYTLSGWCNGWDHSHALGWYDISSSDDGAWGPDMDFTTWPPPSFRSDGWSGYPHASFESRTLSITLVRRSWPQVVSVRHQDADGSYGDPVPVYNETLRYRDVLPAYATGETDTHQAAAFEARLVDGVGAEVIYVPRKTHWLNVNCLGPDGTETGASAATFDISYDGGITWRTGLGDQPADSHPRVGQPIMIRNITPGTGLRIASVTGMTDNGNGTYGLTMPTDDALVEVRTAYVNYTFDVNPDNNDFGTCYEEGAHIRSFDVTKNGVRVATGVSDFCDPGAHLGDQFELTGVSYRDGYRYRTYDLPGYVAGGVWDWRAGGWKHDGGSTFRVTMGAASLWLGIMTEPDTYVVHFDAGAGTTHVPDDLEATCGQDVVIPAAWPQREDHAFEGWLSPDGDASYLPGETIPSLSGVGDAIVTLTARWVPLLRLRVPVAIHYVADAGGAVAGPTDNVVAIENVGTVDAQVSSIRTEGTDGMRLVGDDPGDGEVALGMRPNDGTTIRLADYAFGRQPERPDEWRLPAGAAVFLNELHGSCGAADLHGDTAIGVVHWTFAAGDG